MTVRVVEFGGYVSGRAAMGSPVLKLPPIAAQSIVTGSSASTNTLSSATRLIRIDSDAGAYVFVGSSGSTLVAASSTPSIRVIAGAPAEVYEVSPYSRVCTLST